MLPLLKYIEDGKEYLMRKAIDSLANHFPLIPLSEQNYYRAASKRYFTIELAGQDLILT